MKWLKHDTSERDKQDCALIIDAFGAEGYGAYWIIMEIIGKESDENCQKVSYPESFWRKNLRVSRQKLVTFCEFFESFSIFSVECSGKMITIGRANILDLQDESTRKRRKSSDKFRNDSGPEGEEEEEGEGEGEEKKAPPISPQGDDGESGAAPQEPASRLAAEIMREYNAILTELEPAVVMSSAMWRHLNLNRQEHPERATLDFWVSLFHKARASPHLMGRLKASNWKASLPWLLIPDNVDNVLNGKYPPDKGEENKHARAAKDYGTEVRPIGSKRHAEKGG